MAARAAYTKSSSSIVQEQVPTLYHHNEEHKSARMSYEDLCSSTKAKIPSLSSFYCYAMYNSHPIPYKELERAEFAIRYQVEEWIKRISRLKVPAVDCVIDPAVLAADCVIDIYYSKAHSLIFVDLAWPIDKRPIQTSSILKFSTPGKLQLDSRFLVLLGRRQPREPFKDAIINIRLSPSIDLGGFHDALAEVLKPSGSIIDMWKIKLQELSIIEFAAEWSGMLRVLVSFKISAMRKRQKFLKWLPTHITFDQNRYQLQYQMRDRQCYTFQDRAALNPKFFIKFETTCIYCQGADHKTSNCSN